MTEQDAFGQTRFTAPDLKEDQPVFGGRYVLKQVIGQGGMGVVWKAEDTTLKHFVALKFLPDLVRMDAEAIHRLRSEAKKGRQLHHTNIVAIYDFLEEGGYSAVAMEYVEGDSLIVRKLAKEGECFDPDQIEMWIDQLCDALQYAHQNHGIVHRDIKPANILVDQNDNVRILDFGLSRVMTDSLTRLSAGDFKGASLGYSSPQQINGRPPAISDDVYSLGATIYELLSGQPPFFSGDIFNQTLSQIPPPIEERRADLEVTGKAPVPPHWEQVIAMCLAKEPADRPLDTAEVRTLLRGGKSKRRAGMRLPPAPLVWSAVAAACLFIGGFFVLPALRDFGKSETSPASQSGTPGTKLDSGSAGIPGPGSPPPGKPAITAGTVRLTSIPAGASVYSENGVLLGVTPYTLDSVPAGPVRYRLDKDGYDSIQVSGAVESGKELTLPAKLEALKGSIRLESTPSEAFVFDSGGNLIGRTPLDLDGLSPGRVTYQVTMDGYEDARVEGTVGPGKTTSLSASLKPLLGSVTLTSTPAGASVYSRTGGYLGITPLKLTDVEPGSVFYTFKKSGYGDMKAEDEMKMGQHLSFNAPLKALTPSSPWLFPDSDRRLLTDAELSQLNADQLWKARNEIYARRGYIFTKQKSKDYVASLGSFYSPRYSSESQMDQIFNQFEKANIERIQMYENR